jgi:hypothetical protein
MGMHNRSWLDFYTGDLLSAMCGNAVPVNRGAVSGSNEPAIVCLSSNRRDGMHPNLSGHARSGKVFAQEAAGNWTFYTASLVVNGGACLARPILHDDWPLSAPQAQTLETQKTPKHGVYPGQLQEDRRDRGIGRGLWVWWRVGWEAHLNPGERVGSLVGGWGWSKLLGQLVAEGGSAFVAG